MSELISTVCLSYIQRRPTKRAPDVWDSAAFSSIFLASSFSCSRTESQPAHTQVTQTVGRFAENQMQEQIQILCFAKASES